MGLCHLHPMGLCHLHPMGLCHLHPMGLCHLHPMGLLTLVSGLFVLMNSDKKKEGVSYYN